MKTAMHTSVHSILSPRSPFWQTPRGILLILGASCLFVYLFRPSDEEVVQLPEKWTASLWKPSDSDTYIRHGSGFLTSNRDKSAFAVKIDDENDSWRGTTLTGDDWEAINIKQKLEDARVRKEAWEKKKHEDEEEASRQKEDEARRRKEEAAKKIAKLRQEEENERHKKDEEDRRKEQEDEERGKAIIKPTFSSIRISSSLISDTSSTSTAFEPFASHFESSSDSHKGSTEDQRKAAEKELEAAESLDPANNSKISSLDIDSSNSSTSDISLKLDEAASNILPSLSSSSKITTTLVVGRLASDASSVQWIHDFVRDITHTRIYIVDDPSAPLHLNQNKGREAMVYLRYILDFYDDLDDITLFYHPSRMSWHNNVLFNRDAAVMINHLRREHVLEKGYMNARCELYPGCQNPGWIRFNPSHDQNLLHGERNSDLFSLALWDQLFPNRTSDPIFLSQPCCSQFAVSRETIRNVPRDQYQRIHDWLGTTDEIDGYTGRIMEYTWQYLFLSRDTACPSMKSCYCEGYGLCLEDDSDLRAYNALRTEVDDVLTKLGDWNIENGCTEMEDGVGRDECRKGNPWEDVLGGVRKRKNDAERALPLEFGVRDPLA